MARKFEESLPPKKFLPGCDAENKEIFNFPYLTDEDTLNFLKNHGNIMFIVRGLPNTRKSGLSDLLVETYPSAHLYSADHYFEQSFSSSVKSKEAIAESHVYCEKKVRAAVKEGSSPIIVRNTHVRKWEMQKYIDLAISYGYTVIMAVTMYKFNVTAETLHRACDHGLNLQYYERRLNQWQNVAPKLLGWFVCPEDSTFLTTSLVKIFPALLDDGKFCSSFDFYTESDVQNHFEVRKNLVCLAACFDREYDMQQFYLSDTVQNVYGKSCDVLIRGYFVTIRSIIAFVEFEESVCNLIHHQLNACLNTSLSLLSLSDNFSRFSKTVPFKGLEPTSGKTVFYVDSEKEDLNLDNCSFIHLAEESGLTPTLQETVERFLCSLRYLKEEKNHLLKLENGMSICRMQEEGWFLKLPKSIKVKTVFTGLYC